MGPDVTSPAPPDAAAADAGATRPVGGPGAPAAAPTGSVPLLPEGAHCLDCGAPVLGAWCQSCGQRHGPPVQTLRALLAEAASDLGGPDGRLWRTLQPLLLRPGFLTDEYLAGRHARYLPPFRLYLMCSVVYFAVFFASHSSRFFFIWISGTEPDLVTFVRR